MGIKARLRWHDEAGGQGLGFAHRGLRGCVLGGCVLWGLAAAGGEARAQEGPVIPATPPAPGAFGLTPGTFSTATGAYGAPAAPVAIPAATPGTAATGLEIPTGPPHWLPTPAP